MILRSCKTILQKNLMAQSENQVIPSSDKYEEITYKFHQKVSDENNRFWKGRRLRNVMREKFGIFALTDAEAVTPKNILELLHFPELNKCRLFKSIPKYCHYQGFLY